MSSELSDVIVIGGGVVGLATARALLLRNPVLKVTLLEKERAVGTHQTGHNSGVVHAGIYYKPGTLKAKLCVEGARRMREYAQEKGVPFQAIGKLIVASDESETGALRTLLERGQANGVGGLTWLSQGELREREPHVKGVAGIWSPETGITDYAAVAAAYAADLTAMGCEVVTAERVIAARTGDKECVVTTNAREITGRVLVNCAGLYSDRVALMTGLDPGVRIVPFRGEYYTLRPDRAHLVRGLIYPVPDPSFPFLGVHFTRSVHGSVEAGPNAVLALAREGYKKSSFVAGDAMGTLLWPGFLRLALRFWRTGAAEMRRSYSKRLFAASLGKLVPEVRAEDLAPGGAGVRAQAVDRQGKLVDDFHVVRNGRAVHVLNVPSPAATASLSIADYLQRYVDEALESSA